MKLENRFPVVLAICISFAIVSAQAHSAELVNGLKNGKSDIVEYDATQMGAAVEAGIDPETVVQRGRSGELVLIDSVVPIRQKQPVPISDNSTDAMQYLKLFGDEMGLSKYGESSLIVDQVRELSGGRLKHDFRQYVAGIPVLNSRVSVVVDTQGGLMRLSGRFIPDQLLKDVTTWLPSYRDLASAYPDGTGEKIIGSGLFHGSVFGMTTWDNRKPTLAFVTVRQESKESLSQRFVDWETGETLYSIPLDSRVAPPVDIYDDVDCSFFAPNFYLDGVVRKESNQTCGQGTYASGCSWWPGDSSRIRTTVQSFAGFLDSQFSRYSWDDGQMPECDPDNPNIDPDKCCETASPSIMSAAANWIADNTLEQTCCTVLMLGNPCPGEFLGQTVSNSAFFRPYCYTAFSHQTSCTDVVGHEFTHGIDFSEKQTSGCVAEENSGLYCRHEEAMSEAFPDVIGEAFQRINYPSEAVAWTINDGQSYCTAIRSLQNPATADHASTINWFESERGARTHDNSTAISKGLYLLGRPASEGAVSHYGISVTGIGIVDAAKVFYNAFVEELPDTADRTFSDLRQAFLTSAGSTFGYSSNQYTQTKKMVAALGFWFQNSTWVQAQATPPRLGMFGEVGSDSLRHRTVVYLDTDGKLKFRYRFLMGFPPSYQWAAATEIASAAGSFDEYTESRWISGMLFGYRLHVYYVDQYNKIRHFRINEDGTTTNNPVTYNGTQITVAAGSTLRVSYSTGLFIFYTPSGQTTARYASVSDNTVTSPINTGIPSTANFDVAYQGDRFHAFWIASNILQHKVNTSATQWVEWSLWERQLNTSAFAVESHYGRLHLMTKHTTNGWLYQTCQNNCTEETDWTPSIPIDSKPNMGSDWAVLGRYYDETFDLGLAMQNSNGNMFIRGKVAQ